MKKTDTSTNNVTSYVVVINEPAAAFLEHLGVTDVNGYLNELLWKEKQRQVGRDPTQPGQNLNELMECTPDTSGYPEMQGHFGEVIR